MDKREIGIPLEAAILLSGLCGRTALDRSEVILLLADCTSVQSTFVKG